MAAHTASNVDALMFLYLFRIHIATLSCYAKGIKASWNLFCVRLFKFSPYFSSSIGPIRCSRHRSLGGNFGSKNGDFPTNRSLGTLNSPPTSPLPPHLVPAGREPCTARQKGQFHVPCPDAAHVEGEYIFGWSISIFMTAVSPTTAQQHHVAALDGAACDADCSAGGRWVSVLRIRSIFLN
jgi:hypothetical protein